MNNEKIQSSALMEIPEYAREVVKRVIEKPKFLARLLTEEANLLEEYSKLAVNSEAFSLNYDAWGNCVSVSDDCKGKAKLYRRIVDVIYPQKQ